MKHDNNRTSKPATPRPNTGSSSEEARKDLIQSTHDEVRALAAAQRGIGDDLRNTIRRIDENKSFRTLTALVAESQQMQTRVSELQRTIHDVLGIVRWQSEQVIQSGRQRAIHFATRLTHTVGTCILTVALVVAVQDPMYTVWSVLIAMFAR